MRITSYISHIALVTVVLTSIMDGAHAVERLRMATTTSTEASGLLDILNPPFEKEYGVKLDIIVVGTGKALRIAANGDVDLVLVHAPTAEQKFMESGYGISRHAVMHNDFLIVGPKTDPAKLRQAKTVIDALIKIEQTRSRFISRGDDSGTHKKEKTLWHSAGKIPMGDWYLSTGQGMSAVLRVADDKQSYTLCDRGTYLAMADTVELMPLFEGDSELFNPYHIMAVNPDVHPHVNYKLAQLYIAYITGQQGQTLIANYKKHGQQLFQPDAIAGIINSSNAD